LCSHQNKISNTTDAKKFWLETKKELLQVERTLWSFFMHLKAIHDYFEKQKKIPLNKLLLFVSLTA
jgi:hypothetical protein